MLASQARLTSPGLKRTCLCWSLSTPGSIGCPSLFSLTLANYISQAPLPTGFLLISGKERHPGGDWEEEDSKLQAVLFTFLPYPGPQLCLLWLFSRPLLLVPSGLGMFPPTSSVPPAVCGWGGAACCCCSSLCHLTSPLGFSGLSAPPN